MLKHWEVECSSGQSRGALDSLRWSKKKVPGSPLAFAPGQERILGATKGPWFSSLLAPSQQVLREVLVRVGGLPVPAFTLGATSSPWGSAPGAAELEQAFGLQTELGECGGWGWLLCMVESPSLGSGNQSEFPLHLLNWS